MVRLGDIQSNYLNKPQSSSNYQENSFNFEEFSMNQMNSRLLSQFDQINFNLIVDQPMLSIGMIIFCLLLLKNRIQFSIWVLIACFLFCFNPIYVSIGYFFYSLYLSRFKSPKFKVSLNQTQSLKNESSTKFHPHLKLEEGNFDHVLIGSNLSVLVTAALLSRIGRKCCVLDSHDEPSSDSVELSPLTCFDPTKLNRVFNVIFPKEKAIKFTPIGSAQEGFTHTVISFQLSNDSFETISVRPGLKSFVADFSSNSNCSPHQIDCFKKLHQWCIGTLPHVILIAHTAIDSTVNWSSYFRGESQKWISLLTETTCTDLTHEIVEDSYISCAIRAMSAWISGEFSCPFERLGSISLVNALATTSFTGSFYLQGGEKTLRKRLIEVIQSYNGVVVTHAPIKHLHLDNKQEVIGVVLQPDEGKVIEVQSSKGVISGFGAIPTFAHLIPPSVTSPSIVKCREKLKKLETKRPKLFLVFYLNGSCSSLGLTSVEYVELHNNDNQDDLSNKSFKLWSPSVRDDSWTTQHPNTQTLVFEMEASNRFVRRVKDASHEFIFYDMNSPDTVEKETNSIIQYGTQCVMRVFPLIQESSIQRVEFHAPNTADEGLSLTVEKYMSKISARTEVKGLYLTGRDILTNGLTGEMASALSTTCAVLGYSPAELVAGRNIVTDLEKTIKK